MLRRHGLPGGVATGVAFVALLALLAGIATVIYFSVRNQWGELAPQASSGLDELEQFLLTGPVPVEQEQLDQAREGIVQFASSSQVRSGAITGLSVVTEFIAGASLMVVILLFFLKDGAKTWNFFLRPSSGSREAKLRRVGSRILEVLGRYVRGTAIVCTILAGIVGAVLSVPLAAVAWAIIQVWTAEDPNLADMNPELPPPHSQPA